jgi:flagellar basal body-associated protein FliL
LLFIIIVVVIVITAPLLCIYPSLSFEKAAEDKAYTAHFASCLPLPEVDQALGKPWNTFGTPVIKRESII